MSARPPQHRRRDRRAQRRRRRDRRICRRDLRDCLASSRHRRGPALSSSPAFGAVTAVIGAVIAATGSVIAVTGMRSGATEASVTDVTRTFLTTADYRVCSDSRDHCHGDRRDWSRGSRDGTPDSAAL